ncbi:thioesterase II family protein [Streptacidiphilus jiangxiensis]|uniref:Surfactin synthase thioesterase subunit n=1 Tax=Streptacidiphilus jiangxiensis TaxID=235985 RepID=A0A1H7VNX8_STRJI|nr:alpha/beta fold hydrolase [Streptacidiphilus jiangxiensis]SEM10535.1 Surfactin synthase thioesterase subunit [Streptacidiphilus jiangxiensis]
MLVVRPRPVPDPAVRLFLFHHAGGSHLLYRGWAAAFPPDWELCLLAAPGRAESAAKPPVSDCAELVELFRGAVAPLSDRPFAFYGHSMGALLAYELTRVLLDRGEALPCWLGVSAFGAPRAPQGPAVRRDLLPDPELKELLRRIGGNAERLLEDEGLWRFFGPLFRNDFRLVDSWRPREPFVRLPVPLTAFGGVDDVVVDAAGLAEWAEHTEEFLGVHRYQGDHFYLRSHRDDLARYITAAVASRTVRAEAAERQ